MCNWLPQRMHIQLMGIMSCCVSINCWNIKQGKKYPTDLA